MSKHYKKARKTNGYERNRKHKQKIIRLARDIGRCWYAPATLMTADRDFTYDLNEMAYAKRWYRSRQSKYLKKLASKKARRYKGEMANGCGYRRLFDFWWELT